MKLSVVITVFNEAQNLPALFSRLKDACARYRPFEVICVDDGSRDDSLAVLLKEKRDFPELKIVKLAFNCGKSDALAAGIAQAKGEWVAMLDADLQDPPEEIPKLMEALEGCDGVNGWRFPRNDTWPKRFASRFANWFRNLFLRDGMHDTGSPLKVVRREALLNIPMFRGSHRFIPALLLMHGYTVKEIKVRHEGRVLGRSKSKTFGRAVPAFFDLLGVVWLKKRALRYKIEKVINGR